MLEEATETLRVRMGGDIHKKVRDFLQVHNKGGQPCPKCGGNITQLNANQTHHQLLPPLPAGNADPKLTFS